MRLGSQLAIVLCLLLGVASAKQQVRISGRVVDKETKSPLIANVVVSGTGYGTVARSDGSFTLEFESDESEFELKVFLIGYKAEKVRAKSGDFIGVELEVKPIPLSEILVTPEASLGTESPEKTVTITKMEIYRTPGAAADPLYAVQLLPGFNSPPDASSILVQGGGPEETLYILDGIEVGHPFQVEAGDVSYFSIFDTQVVKRNRVATAGFPCRYGDALSGVVDLRTEEDRSRIEGGLGMHMVGGSAIIGVPFDGGTTLIASYKSVKSRLMEKIYGSDGTYGGDNVFVSLKFPLSANSSVRMLGLNDWYEFNRSGSSPLNMRSDNRIGGLIVRTVAKSLVSHNTVSISSYDADYRLTEGDVGIEERRAQVRSDWTYDAAENIIEFGLDWSRRENVISKSFGSSIDSVFDATGNRFGAYVSARSRLSRRTFVEYGIRSSALDLANYKIYFDPRVSVAYFIRQNDVLRFSAGIYHQFGDYWYTKTYSLQPKLAYHCLLCFDHVGEIVTARVTAYDKEYRNLFLYGDKVTNDGWGFARGVELFLKMQMPGSGITAIYNFLDSKRKENESTALSPSPYEIDHSFSVSTTLDFFGATLGTRYSFARGLPYTPLIDTAIDEGTGDLIPVWGEPNSQRLPAYHRLDISLSKSFLIGRSLLVVFISGNNVTDRKNVVGYEYGEDYSRRQIEAIFGRAFVAGFYVSF